MFPDVSKASHKVLNNWMSFEQRGKKKKEAQYDLLGPLSSGNRLSRAAGEISFLSPPPPHSLCFAADSHSHLSTFLHSRDVFLDFSPLIFPRRPAPRSPVVTFTLPP